ncbi:MAG: efflux transporter outer membrane subunit [Burkholderiales bacterium]|nr:efflux transporter outer membrane subunit [Burkholderiales bacterium]
MMRSGLFAVVGLLAACTTVGPDYRRPAVSLPVAFQESGPWREARPADDHIRGDWWTLFGDPVLDDLEQRARDNSPRLQAAVARLDQARAALGFEAAARLPSVDFAPEVGGFGASGNRPDQPEKVPTNRQYDTTRLRVPLIASYEVDLWGRVRRSTESALARLDASAASYQTLMLTLQGEVAQTYFQLRAVDEQQRIVQNNLDIRRRGRDLVVLRKQGGLASELDLSRVDAELAAAEAEAVSLKRRRGELERALAVLVGATPESFSLPEANTRAQIPVVPVGLPADLLERRPDVAEAERLLAARNAQIGVATAAFFPAVRLTGAFGVESSDLSDLLRSDSVLWGLTGGLIQPIFDGGRNRARLERARAAYAEGVADYRQKLLVALEEVENALAALRMFDEQAQAQARRLAGAERAADLATIRYKAGLVIVLEVIDAQRVRLQAEREASQLRAQQLLAGIALIKALGGGWTPDAPVGAVPPAAASANATPGS